MLEQEVIVPMESLVVSEAKAETNTLEELLGQTEPRRFVVGMHPSQHIESILGQYLLESQLLVGATSEARAEIEALKPILKALRRGNVVSFDPRTGDPRDQEIKLSGQQIVELHDFFSSEQVARAPQIVGFVEHLVDDYPNAEPVEKTGERIKGFFLRMAGQEG